jgi:hypothetical protein
MIRYAPIRIALLATALIVATAAPAAGQWSDRTTITFSAPVMIPGTTIQPGSYVFERLDRDTSLYVIQIRDSAGKIVGVANAVPAKRTETTEDTVLLFSPTTSGTMAVMRGWYPSGGRHGFVFVYDKDEAKSIVERTRSVVLSRNVAGTAKEGGTIVLIDGTGERSWTQDPEVQREWDTYRATSRAAIVAEPTKGERVEIDELTDKPDRYMGRTLSVDGDVDEVLGPNLFVLEEPGSGQQDGEVFVLVPPGMTANLRKDARVTVTGTVKKFTAADLAREAPWLNVNDKLKDDLTKKPVIVATRVVTADR